MDEQQLFHNVPLAGLSNLVASFVVLLPGVAVFWFCRPRVFQERPYTKRAFVFWLVQWFLLIVVWAVFKLQAGSEPQPPAAGPAVLACADLYVVGALGLFWAVKEAGEFDWQAAFKNLVGVFALLLLWNLVFFASLVSSADGSLRWLWILPSEVLAFSALSLQAWVFFKRYGYRALPLSGVTIPLYAVLQGPAYASVFLSDATDTHWLTVLAFCKVLFGLVFYTLFFTSAETHEPIRMPTFYLAGTTLRRTLEWVGGAAAMAIVSAVAHNLVDWLNRFMHLH